MTITEQGDKPKLTVKQEAFARAYVECGNASEAYRRSYNVSPETSGDVIKVKACELLKNGNVAVTVLQLKEHHAKRHEITVDSLTAMLVEDRVLARTVEEPKAAIDAVMAIAKLHGKIIDKVEAKQAITAQMTVSTVDAPPAETREEWLARRKRELARNAQAVVAPTGAAN